MDTNYAQDSLLWSKGRRNNEFFYMYEIAIYLGQQDRLYGKVNNHNMLGILSTLSLKKIRTMNTISP